MTKYHKISYWTYFNTCVTYTYLHFISFITFSIFRNLGHRLLRIIRYKQISTPVPTWNVKQNDFVAQIFIDKNDVKPL